MTLQQLSKSWAKQKKANNTKNTDIKLQACFQAFQTAQFSGKTAKSLENIKSKLISSLKKA